MGSRSEYDDEDEDEDDDEDEKLALVLWPTVSFRFQEPIHCIPNYASGRSSQLLFFLLSSHPLRMDRWNPGHGMSFCFPSGR